MKQMTKRVTSAVLILSFLVGMFIITPQESVAAQVYNMYVGESVSNQYGSAVTATTSSDEGVVQAVAEGNKVTFYGRKAGTASVSISTAGNAAPAVYQFKVSDNKKLFKISYVGKKKLGSYNEYIYEIKNNSKTNFSEIDFECILPGANKAMKDPFLAYILPAKGKCVGVVRCKKNVKNPKKIKFNVTNIFRSSPFVDDITVSKSKIAVRQKSLNKGKVYGNQREWSYKFVAYNVYPDYIGYEIYGYAYDDSGKVVGYVMPYLLEDGILSENTKRVHSTKLYISKSVSNPKIKVWMNAVVLH